MSSMMHYFPENDQNSVTSCKQLDSHDFNAIALYCSPVPSLLAFHFLVNHVFHDLLSKSFDALTFCDSDTNHPYRYSVNQFALVQVFQRK